MTIFSEVDMKRTLTLSVLMVAGVCGCAAQQLARLKSEEAVAEQVYAATTQATAVAKDAVADMPIGAAHRVEAASAVASSEKVEQTARLALDLARSAVAAAEKKDAADPALRASLAAAISAIPTPWTPLLAALIPATVPLVFSVLQSFKLGQVHQTVASVTQQLEEHRAALASLGKGSEAVVPTKAG
jgi:hypothetical protein